MKKKNTPLWRNRQGNGQQNVLKSLADASVKGRGTKKIVCVCVCVCVCLGKSSWSVLLGFLKTVFIILLSVCSLLCPLFVVVNSCVLLAKHLSSSSPSL